MLVANLHVVVVMNDVSSDSKTLLSEIRILNKVSDYPRLLRLTMANVMIHYLFVWIERVCCGCEHRDGGPTPLICEWYARNCNRHSVSASRLAHTEQPASRSVSVVKRMQTMPHSREVAIKIGFIPCRFIR